jgi:predicted metal-dependent hydrolase
MIPDRPLPPYTFVPDGPFPHPKSHPDGHSYGQAPSRPPALDPARWADSADYLFGCDLFNAGFYWEAHETWEGLWHAAGRRGPIADLLKGLIALAAAGVKVRERRPAGVAGHARRAADLFAKVSRQLGETEGVYLGLRLRHLLEAARLAEKEASGPIPEEDWNDSVRIVFPFVLMPEPLP